MAELKLEWHSGQHATGVDSWGNMVAIDGDRESGKGAKPSDLLPISLAACAAYTMVEILKKQRQSFTRMQAKITCEQEEKAPWAFTSIKISFEIEGDVDQVKAEKALHLSHTKYCSVAASLGEKVATEFDVRVV